MPRPKAVIDIAQFEKLAQIHATIDEAAWYFGVKRLTLIRRMKEPEYRDAWDRGQANGRISLRRLQFQAATKGNTAMLIWLGKQILGQRDVIPEKVDDLPALEIKILRDAKPQEPAK
jgi:hypothetical protein